MIKTALLSAAIVGSCPAFSVPILQNTIEGRHHPISKGWAVVLNKCTMTPNSTQTQSEFSNTAKLNLAVLSFYKTEGYSILTFADNDKKGVLSTSREQIWFDKELNKFKATDFLVINNDGSSRVVEDKQSYANNTWNNISRTEYICDPDALLPIPNR